MLKPQALRAIRRRLARGESQRSIARRFGVSEGTISHIATGRLYNDVPGEARRLRKAKGLGRTYTTFEIREEIRRQRKHGASVAELVERYSLKAGTINAIVRVDPDVYRHDRKLMSQRRRRV